MGYDLEGKLEDDKTPVFARRALRALRSALSDATKAVLPGKAKNGPTSSGASGARSTAINVPAVAVSAAVICAVWCLVRKPRRQAKRQISSGSLILKVPDLEVHFCKVGASITRILTPDASGKMEDIVLGHPNQALYATDPPGSYFGAPLTFCWVSLVGCVVGRVANRIANGRFTIASTRAEHVLEQNDGQHALHGGSHHWGRQTWESSAALINGWPSITFTRTSPNKESGYPGTVHATVTYTLSHHQGHPSLRVCMKAVASEATPVNMVQHTYWNLAGESAVIKGADIRDHTVRLLATHMTPAREDLIPTGAIVPVSGTVFDFSQPSLLREKLSLHPTGFDNNWVTIPPAGTSAKWDKALCSQPGGMVSKQTRLVAEVSHAASGRTLQVETNAPGLQLYTGNFLGDTPGKDRAVYGKHAGLCLESQTFPNGVNQEGFPSPVLEQNQKYQHMTRFTFNKTLGRAAAASTER